jgi:hypothetical protein
MTHVFMVNIVNIMDCESQFVNSIELLTSNSESAFLIRPEKEEENEGFKLKPEYLPDPRLMVDLDRGPLPRHFQMTSP